MPLAHPIFYSWEGISIMEMPDGRRFEYKLNENRTEKIIANFSFNVLFLFRFP
jgi:hypothetical protein